MPILKHAIKKLRVDDKRTERNKIVRTAAKSALKKARAMVSAETLKEAFSAVDRAAKKNVFHKSKANRIKSRLSKLLSKAGSEEKVVKAAVKKVAKVAKKVSKKK